MKNKEIKASSLAGAMRRIGGQMRMIEDVEGEFVPHRKQAAKGRIYGLFKTHDANVQIAFDSSRVTLPALQEASLRVTGKMWLNVESATLTLMVSEYIAMADKSFHASVS